MLAVKPEYVVDHKSRRRAVQVRLSEWRKIMAELEELDDIRAYDKAKMRGETSVPFEEAVRRIKAGGRH